MRFSQRAGIAPVRSLLQTDSVDQALRNRLWNVLQRLVWDTHRSNSSYYKHLTSNSNLYGLIRAYWSDYYVQALDQIPDGINQTVGTLRDYFFECEWFELYDFIEFTALHMPEHRDRFIDLCNQALTKELSAYRFVDGQIVRTTTEVEINSIEQAIQNPNAGSGTTEHLRTAMKLLSDRTNPDYRNSIKESISAVESVVQKMTGDQSASLGEALKKIPQFSSAHPALNKAFSALYGYTSSADGIRHALLDEESSVDFPDAMFMLVACSAFVNYLFEKTGSQS